MEVAQTTKRVVKLGGLGGQGVLTAGLLLAQAGMNSFKFATWFPSYSAAMRGGEVDCTVILSQKEINSPIISRPEIVVVMSLFSLDMFEEKVLPNGMLFLDSSVVKREIKRKDLQVFKIPASDIAVELSSSQVSNLILLGAVLKATNIFPLEEIEIELERKLKEEGKESLLPINKQALERGAGLV
jgi:2-oxoglutarate ferredoxin oxidoreductase subunit gamma